MIADTNLIIAHLRGVPKATSFMEQHADLSVPFVVVAELMTGANLARKPDTEMQRVSSLIAAFPVLWPDTTTVNEFARLTAEMQRAGTSLGTHDAWIAAFGRQFAVPVATGDLAFNRVPNLKVVLWPTD